MPVCGCCFEDHSVAWLFLWALAGLVLAGPGCAVTARRLHDLGLSGWHVLWLVGLSGGAVYFDDHHPPTAYGLSAGLAVFGLGLLFMPGETNENAHGPPPG